MFILERLPTEARETIIAKFCNFIKEIYVSLNIWEPKIDAKFCGNPDLPSMKIVV